MQLPSEVLGQQTMIFYIDIYGNEYTEIKTLVDFGRGETDGER